MTNFQGSLPDLTFTSTATQPPEDLIPCAEIWNGNRLKDPVIAETPLANVRWSTLFAYMHRRFGPPHVGGDDYKDLSAGWIINSPNAEVFVRVSPSLTGPGFSLTPFLAVDRAGDALRARHLSLPDDRIATVRAAYKATLLDLLRPVCVHDSHINALGELTGSDLDEALLGSGEDDGHNYEVERHPSSGFSMPLGLFGGDDWSTLCSLIYRLGSNNMEAGRAAMIDLLQRDTFARDAAAGWAVHRLMLLGAWNGRDKLAKGLGLSEADLGRFTAEMAVLHDPAKPDRSIVDEMTDETVAKAIDLLTALGHDDGNLVKTVHRLRQTKACIEAWAELVAIAKNDFPDSAMIKEPHGLGDQLPVELKRRFETSGRPDLVAWVDATIARPSGASALADMIWYLSEQAAKALAVATGSS